ncbi:MAG: hypothetical protein IT349_04345 [Candidatus Eisenbacteria bacterium]|nr:hypothetical protein [Candidatus Eisenbacteria bacterium]MCC7141311.1 hypothetical protein [Candidatus Eisenbacteria bacterium]
MRADPIRTECRARTLAGVVSAAIAALVLVAGPAPEPASAQDEASDLRASNWERLCVLGFVPVVERVLASSGAERRLEPGERRRVPGAGPDLYLQRAGADLLITLKEGRAAGQKSARADTVDDVRLYDLDDDGTVERIVDYQDLDGDGKAERQVLYGVHGGMLHHARLALLLFEQYDDDGRFFALTHGQYEQKHNQWDCDYSCNGFFTAAQYDETTRRWLSFEENPFCFYDHDQDGFTDEVLRISGETTRVTSFRWSWDLDHDAGRPSASNPQASPYDYDLAVIGVGRVVAPAARCDTLFLRPGDPNCGADDPMSNRITLVDYTQARDFVAEARWEKFLLCFDENDRNVDPGDPEAHDRWEGIIAEEVPGFQVVGGPPCALHDKRYELDRDASGSGALYHSEIDGRVHLWGADWGQIEHDANGDGRTDEILRTEDRDQDGVFDTWLWDGNADRTWEVERHVPDASRRVTRLARTGQSPLPALREVERARLASGGAAPLTQEQCLSRDLAAWRAGRPPIN